MEKMKAILCKKYGVPETLQIGQVKKPALKSDEVLIKIYATSVTDSDIFIRSSKLPVKWHLIPFRLMMGIRAPRNPIIGEVFAGKIEAVGSEIKRFSIGDKVFGLTGFSLGAYADYKCMREADSKKGCLEIMPENITFEEATAVAYGGLLSLQFMEKGTISLNSKVLIYGASGTTGIIAIQYAKFLGASVTGVCSTVNVDFVKALGADKVIDYTKPECTEELEQYDFILDAVGKTKTSNLKKACARTLTKNGKYASISESPLLLESNRLNTVKKLVEDAKIKPMNGRVYPFEQIVEAHRYVETGHKRGNVAITVNSDS